MSTAESMERQGGEDDCKNMDLEEGGYFLFEAVIPKIALKFQQKPWKTSARTVGNAELSSNMYLPDTSVDFYSYTKHMIKVR